MSFHTPLSFWIDIHPMDGIGWEEGGTYIDVAS